MKLILTSTLLFFGLNAFANTKRLAECHGQSDAGNSARAVLFVDLKDNTKGMVFVTVDQVGDYASETTINWRANPQGFPRFFDNDFDLDVVISRDKSSTDDILVGNEYFGDMTCSYSPL